MTLEEHRNHQKELMRELHPGYDQEELEESLATLRTFFDLGWRIFVRLESEGRLGDLHLTDDKPKLTMKRQ